MEVKIGDTALFVFGSNLAGRHGAGAAKEAREFYGAVPGCGEGPTGMSYALPTKDEAIETLPIERVAEAVDRFKRYATTRPDLLFYVTRIGCGLAGFTDEQMAPLFAGAPDNCLLPGKWLPLLGSSERRLLVAGSRQINQWSLAAGLIDERLQSIGAVDTHLVSGMAPGADTLAVQYARQTYMGLAEFPADWDRLKRPAGHLRNTLMAGYATDALVLWDGASPGTKDMLGKLKNFFGVPTRLCIIRNGRLEEQTDILSTDERPPSQQSLI